MPSNNYDQQGAANNQVSFLRNKLNFESSNRNRKSSRKPPESLMFDEDGENVVS